MQRCGLLSRFDAERGDQRASAGQELTKCVSGAPGSGNGDHQAAVCRLVPRIELDEPPGDIQGFDGLAGALVCVAERGEQLYVTVDQSFPPWRCPLGVARLEHWLASP